MDIPDSEPAVVYAGDNIAWSKIFADYPSGDGWVLTYALRNSEQQINLADEISTDGEGFLVAIDAEGSGAWAPGDYYFQGYVTKDGERHTVSEGKITVRQNLAAIQQPIDNRSHNQKMYDNLCATLEARSKLDYTQMSKGDRQIWKEDIEKLEREKTRYATLLRREKGLGFYGVTFQ